MRILLKLFLTYSIYLGCVIYEVLIFSKSCTVRVFAINVPNYERSTVLIDLNNGSESNKIHYLGVYHHPIEQFTTNKSKRENEISVLLQHNWNAMKHSHLFSQMNVDMTHQRKLFQHEQNFLKIHPGSKFFNGISNKIISTRISDLTKRKRDVNGAKVTELNDEDIDWAAWDNWSVWSACSVTCGQGRQVRWRHCLSANCIEGLKKAQLKNCYFKECGTKGFLGWLGIKS